MKRFLGNLFSSEKRNIMIFELIPMKIFTKIGNYNETSLMISFMKNQSLPVTDLIGKPLSLTITLRICLILSVVGKADVIRKSPDNKFIS